MEVGERLGLDQQAKGEMTKKGAGSRVALPLGTDYVDDASSAVAGHLGGHAGWQSHQRSLVKSE